MTMFKFTPEEEQAFDEAFAEDVTFEDMANVRGSTEEVLEELASVNDPDVLDRILAVARQKDFCPEKHARLLSACRKMLTGLTSH